jgi:hypothetical protein
MLSLITDRTSIDASEINSIKINIYSRGWTAISTLDQTTFISGKGQYTPDDLNRVGSAINTLSTLLNGYGYGVSATGKTDWVRDDIPNMSSIGTYLSDVSAIKTVFYGTTDLPSITASFTYTDANNIEALLLEVEENINNMVSAFWYCGEIRSGER